MTAPGTPEDYAAYMALSHEVQGWFEAWREQGADTDAALSALQAWDARDDITAAEHRTMAVLAIGQACVTHAIAHHRHDLVVDARIPEVPEPLREVCSESFEVALEAIGMASAGDGEGLAVLVLHRDGDERIGLRYALLRVAQGALTT